MEARHCTQCGAEVPDGAGKCAYCGTVVGAGISVPEIEKTSGSKKAKQSTAGMISPKNKLLVYALCMFLGVFGAHRFYVGKIKTGILYLFTFGLFLFGWAVDLIWIYYGKFKDSNGLPVQNTSDIFVKQK